MSPLLEKKTRTLIINFQASERPRDFFSCQCCTPTVQGAPSFGPRQGDWGTQFIEILPLGPPVILQALNNESPTHKLTPETRTFTAFIPSLLLVPLGPSRRALKLRGGTRLPRRMLGCVV